MFLQKSFEYAMTNSKWVIRLVVELEEAGLSYHDPFLGYLLGIAATIQLEQTVSKKRHVASNARRNFEKARSFIRQLSRQWPNMLNLVSRPASRCYHFAKTILTLPAVQSARPTDRSPQAASDNGLCGRRVRRRCATFGCS